MQDTLNIMGIDKAKGVIFGLAIGDALGFPTEFTSLSRIKAEYGQSGIKDLPDPALFTDDTQMSIAIAEALIKTGDGEIETIMDAVKDEFVKWRHSPENNRCRSSWQGCSLMKSAHVSYGMHFTGYHERQRGC